MSNSEDTTTARTAWLEARRDGIGASDIGSILGVPGAWGSALSVYADKLGHEPIDPHVSDPQVCGLVNEAGILRLFVRETGGVILDHMPITAIGACEIHYGPDADGVTILRSKDHPWMMLSPDAFAEVPGIGVVYVDAKNHSLGKAKEYDESAYGMPPYIYAQLQQAMAVTGLQHAAVAAMIGGTSWRIKVCERDPDFIARIVEAGADMVRRIIEQDQPAADGTDATRKAIGLLHPDENGETIDLGPEGPDLDLEFVEAKAAAKLAAARVMAIENQIKARIGDALAGASPNGSIFKFGKVTHKKIRCDLAPEDLRALAHFADDAGMLDLCAALQGAADKGPASYRKLSRKAPKVPKVAK